MKKEKFNLLKEVMLIAIWTLSLNLFSQNLTVNGTVKDATGELLIGVTVQVQGTGIGTVTDVNGHFVLRDVPSGASLEISYVGMETVVVPVERQTRFDILLKEDTDVGCFQLRAGYGSASQTLSCLSGCLVNESAPCAESRLPIVLSERL